jgi:hypothetical protein
MLVEDCYGDNEDVSEDQRSPQAITTIKSVDHGITMIADLNETAIEFIYKEMYEEAGESLLYAFEAIPKIEKLHKESKNVNAGPLDYSYFSTIYYNLAFIYQKLS